MLGFSINNEFLELDPGTALEMERNNPFLQFGSEIQGDYSLPFQVKNTPTNLRLFGLVGMIQKRIDNTGIDVKCYDHGYQNSIGKIKFEKTLLNLNHSKEGSVSCYYLTGASAFYQDAKGLKLRTIDMGGVKTFSWDNFDRYGSGFWGHIHKVIDAAPGSFDYAFYPVINKDFTGDTASTEVMNWMEYNGTINFKRTSTDKNWANVIIPFPYLKKVLVKAIEKTGWKLEGDILNDASFNLVTMVNFRAINWGVMNAKDVILNGFPHGLNPISFNLVDHLPDITITDFLLGLRNRFGWWYDYDKATKTIRIKPVKEVVTGPVKNMTAFASPLIPKTINADKKIYALKNTFIGSYTGGQPDLKAVQYKGTLASLTNLPAATEALYAACYLIITENNYYICRQNVDTQNWEWQLFSYNVYDYVPDGATDDITTAATTLGNESYGVTSTPPQNIILGLPDTTTYLDFIPRMDLAGEWVGQSDAVASWGVHLLFYYGKRNNKSGQPYPFASSGVYDSTGALIGTWSLAFECVKLDGTQVGLLNNWRQLLATITSNETLETTLTLPLTEYMQLRFDQVISIQHVRLFITTIKSKISYPGSVDLVCSRI